MSQKIVAEGDDPSMMISSNNLTESHKAAEEESVLLESENIVDNEERNDGEKENEERDVSRSSEIDEGQNELNIQDEVVVELDQIYTETIEPNEEEKDAVASNGSLKLKRKPSTIDVVNCDEDPEACEMGSLNCYPRENEDLEDNDLDLRELAVGAMRHAEEIVRKMLLRVSWTICHFHALPKWLQDNDFIRQGYRPPLPSFWDCIKSIFSIHTETGNIWTHMLGCIAFLGVASFFLSCEDPEIRTEDKMVFSAFFTGACVCLGLSTCFHTFLCHSEWAGQLFSKLDYVGIALLIMGSFVPWLYYSFYCDFYPRVIYLCIEIILGITSIVVSLWPRFGEPKYRPLRAGVFMSFGLSGVIPAVHYSVAEGWLKALNQASLGWLILMGLLYIIGTMFYALRIPERFFPGKFDIWFQSHQIFHVFVVAAAFVHYHGISEMAMHRLSVGECPAA